MSSSVRLQQAVTATLLTLGLTAATDAQVIPAFPGADGAAANVTGGRNQGAGQIVYHVTKLNSAIDDPQRNHPGTIRYGLNNSNFPSGVPRTIVFDVGGVFNLGRLPQPNAVNGPWDPNGNGWDAQSRLSIGGTNVTLAGQSAPGAGVIFMGGGLKPQGNNNIIRNVTMASGYGLSGWWSPGNAMPAVPGSAGASTDPAQWFPDNVVYDAMDISGTNLMIDHVSTIFATDETVSMNEASNNITVQYSNISQGLNYPQWDAEGGGLTGHALGSLLSAGSTTSAAAITFHHNLYAHQKGRVPQLGTVSGSQGGYYDFRNNVFYNWLGTAGSKSGTTFLNLVNNFYLAGPGGDNPIGGTNPGISTSNGGTGVISASSTLHRSGNLLDSNKDGDANDGTTLSNSGGAANALWLGGTRTYNGATDLAAQAFDRVLNYMGANWWNRDAVVNTPDERIINEARTGTGKIIAWADDPWNAGDGAEWQALKNTPQTSRAVDWDTEASVGYGVGDGMPTWWEIAHGLDPNVRDDAGDFDSDGYTNLEEYLNEIAEWPAPGALVFDATTNNRYAQITNWDSNPDPTADLPWQPSKFDTAQINVGTVLVDAVGQHAGTLQVNNSATLSVTGGWINVANATVIAAGASLNQSGGLASVAHLSGAGTVNLGGGELLARSIRVSNVTLVAGVAQVLRGGTSASTSKIVNLSITAGQLDLTNNNLVVTATPIGSWDGSDYSGVTGMLASGRNGGSWNGAGIATSQLDATSGYTALAVATASEALGIGASVTTTWSGQTVAGDDALVMYTYGGDANLSGNVDIDDYTQIDANASLGGILTGWFNGDFDYNGISDIDDYTIIDSVIGIQGPPVGTSGDAGMTVAAVPEPSTACGLAVLGASLLTRRKRR